MVYSKTNEYHREYYRKNRARLIQNRQKNIEVTRAKARANYKLRTREQKDLSNKLKRLHRLKKGDQIRAREKICRVNNPLSNEQRLKNIAQNKAYRTATPERIEQSRAYAQEYRQRQPQGVLREQNRVWRAANPEHILEYQRKYRRENKEVIAKTIRKWRLSHKEQIAKAHNRHTKDMTPQYLRRLSGFTDPKILEVVKLRLQIKRHLREELP